MITALHYSKQSLNRSYGWNSLLPAKRSVVGPTFVVLYKSCSDVSDLCHEIAILWLLGTFAFDDLVIVAITEFV